MNDSEDLPLSRTAASEAVEAIGWRHLLGTLMLSVPVTGLAEAATVAAAAVTASGADADGHLRVDLRPGSVELSLQDRAQFRVTERDVRVAHQIDQSLRTVSPDPAESRASPRPVQSLELAIDAFDIGAVRPFWKAVMGYIDEPGGGDEGGLNDPSGQLPAVWFQQMDVPRPQRNRIHFDITVSHDEAPARLAAAIAAGGRLINESRARAFWILADAEGNEACICTWQDRDPPAVQ